MYCSNCGKQLEDGARFCKYCGAPTSHSETPVSEPADKHSIKQEDRALRENPVMVTEPLSLKFGRATFFRWR